MTTFQEIGTDGRHWKYRDSLGQIWTLGFDLSKALKAERIFSTGKELAATMPEAEAQTIGHVVRTVVG